MDGIYTEYKRTRKLPRRLERCLVAIGVLFGFFFVFKFINVRSNRTSTEGVSRRRSKTAIVILVKDRIRHTKRTLDGIHSLNPQPDYTIAYRDSNSLEEIKKMTRQRCDYVVDVPEEIHENQHGMSYWRPTQSPLRTTWIYLMTNLWGRFPDLKEVCYFEDDIYPHPQFLKIVREARKHGRGRLESSTQNEKKRQKCQRCRAGGSKDGGVSLENGMCREYCSSGEFCGNTAQYRNGGTDCTFLKETSVKRVWSFKGRVGQDITNVNELQNFNGDNSMAVPMCITFEEYYLFIQNVADDFCLQSGGGMNAWDIALMTLQQQDLLPPLRYTSDNVVAVHLRGSDFDKHEASIQALLQTSPTSKATSRMPKYGVSIDPDPWVDLDHMTKNVFLNSDDWTQNRPPLREYINTIGTCFRLTSNALTKLKRLSWLN